jgi:hypothetical protein
VCEPVFYISSACERVEPRLGSSFLGGRNSIDEGQEGKVVVATMCLLYIEQQKTHNILFKPLARLPFQPTRNSLPLGRGINYTREEKEGPSTATMTIIMDACVTPLMNFISPSDATQRTFCSMEIMRGVDLCYGRKTRQLARSNFLRKKVWKFSTLKLPPWRRSNLWLRRKKV